MQTRPPASQSIVDALTRPVETTAAHLIAEYNWSERDLLDAVAELQGTLNSWGVELEPPLGKYDLDQPRVLRRQAAAGIVGKAAAEIAGGEGAECEFKESIYLDAKKHLLGGVALEKCGSEKVLFSLLKTIAAFQNTAGGTLFAGVADDGSAVGLEREYPLVCPKDRNFDHWELFLRGKIEQHFCNGKAATASVVVNRVELGGCEIARIQVGARRGLTVVTEGTSEVLYVRGGNRTLSVTPSELEQYFELRKLYL
ncbi:MAG TPA: ATP-binding protein [Sphingomicrobium sp.]|nr:ATP-binding protein [Sphingomicrobium sp.]